MAQRAARDDASHDRPPPPPELYELLRASGARATGTAKGSGCETSPTTISYLISDAAGTDRSPRVVRAIAAECGLSPTRIRQIAMGAISRRDHTQGTPIHGAIRLRDSLQVAGSGPGRDGPRP